MHCQEFEDRLQSLLDERRQPDADPQLRRHARECDACQQLLTDQRKLFVALAALTEPSLPPQFSGHVLRHARMSATVVGTGTGKGTRAGLALGVLLTSAAAALFGIWLVSQARRGDPGVVANSGASDAVSVAAVQRRDQSATGPSMPRGPMGMLALGRADWLIEAPRIHDHLDSIDSLAATLPQTVERFDEVERFAPGVRPLRASFSVIWDTLKSTLPGATSDAPTLPRPRTSGFLFEQVFSV